MPNHNEIYQQQAEKYDRMISRQPKLLTIIESMVPLTGKDVVDLGAGTGRLTCEIAPVARSIVALDAEESMLMQLSNKLQNIGLTNWVTQVANHLELPLPNHSADVIVAGWTICYLGSSNQDEWQQQIEQVMLEIRRVLRPGGTVIIFETMGTGFDQPNPPEFLKGYFALLENKYGFVPTTIPFDYQFTSVEEAEELTRFFFSDELADRVIENNWSKVPEYAGIWRLDVSDESGNN